MVRDYSLLRNVIFSEWLSIRASTLICRVVALLWRAMTGLEQNALNKIFFIDRRMNICPRVASYLLSDREGLMRTPVAFSSLQPRKVCRKADREQAGIVWRLPPPSMPAVPFLRGH